MTDIPYDKVIRFHQSLCFPLNDVLSIQFVPSGTFHGVSHANSGAINKG